MKNHNTERKIKRRRSRLKQNGINPKHFSASQLKFYAYLIPICIVMGLPILFIVSNAFKPMDELMAYPPRFFVKHPTLNNNTPNTAKIKLSVIFLLLNKTISILSIHRVVSYKNVNFETLCLCTCQSCPLPSTLIFYFITFIV